MTRMSTVAATDPADDIAVLREMANEFEDYIIKDDVYRMLVITTWRGDERVQSSGGDLLSRLHKLRAQRAELKSRLRTEFDELEEVLTKKINSMRTRFLGLLEREVKTRLNALKWFMDECKDDRKQCRIQYPFEIRNRQRIAEIWKVLGDDQANELRKEIDIADRRLRALCSPSKFVWDEQLEYVYPKNEYWYLYALPSL